jgi:hypothetical protein
LSSVVERGRFWQRSVVAWSCDAACFVLNGDCEHHNTSKVLVEKIDRL